MKTDYSHYYFSRRERRWVWIQTAGMTALLNYLFYRSWYGFFLFLPVAVIWIPYYRRRRQNRRMERLNDQFKDALLSLSVALRAGYSLENAVAEAVEELRQMHGSSADMVLEFTAMANSMKLNRSLEDMLEDLGRRSRLDDIRQIAAVLVTAKRMGGDMAGILMKSAFLLEEKIDVKKEIAAIIAGKKMEQKVMSCMPILIIFYMQVSSPGFLDCLYGNWMGAGVMTGCLVIYGAAWRMAERIVEIEV